MSSWLSRVACRYDTMPSELLARLDPKNDNYAPRGIDWRMSGQQKDCLAAAARIDPAAVVGLDAASAHPRWAQYWFSVNSAGRDPWNDRDIYGDEFSWAWCSLCLTDGYRETRQHYIRLSWTLACVGYCHRHKRILTRRCACGETRKPVHVAEGPRTRLICRSCGRSVAAPAPEERREPWRLNRAIDLQLAFERDLIAALNGKRPAVNWCGKASNQQLLALVDDIAYAVCTRRSYFLVLPIEGFFLAKQRLHHVPDMEHKLCALSPFWRASALAAILSIIGSEDVCKVMSFDRSQIERPPYRRFLKWRGSLDWMVSHLQSYDVRRLIARSTRWPARTRDMLSAAVADARRNGTYFDPFERAQGRLGRKEHDELEAGETRKETLRPADIVINSSGVGSGKKSDL